jgi:hypothetical protein
LIKPLPEIPNQLLLDIKNQNDLFPNYGFLNKVYSNFTTKFKEMVYSRLQYLPNITGITVKQTIVEVDGIKSRLPMIQNLKISQKFIDDNP